MARRIIWSPQARNDSRKIVGFWNRRNKSIRFSTKLVREFRETIGTLAEQPYTGKKLNIPDTRYCTVRAYLIIYKISREIITVLRIWDSRQDPEKLESFLK